MIRAYYPDGPMCGGCLDKLAELHRKGAAPIVRDGRRILPASLGGMSITWDEADLEASATWADQDGTFPVVVQVGEG